MGVVPVAVLGLGSFIFLVYMCVDCDWDTFALDGRVWVWRICEVSVCLNLYDIMTTEADMDFAMINTCMPSCSQVFQILLYLRTE